MRDSLKIYGFLLIVAVAIVFLTLKHMDQPLMHCDEYMTEINGDINHCEGGE